MFLSLWPLNGPWRSMSQTKQPVGQPSEVLLGGPGAVVFVLALVRDTDRTAPRRHRHGTRRWGAKVEGAEVPAMSVRSNDFLPGRPGGLFRALQQDNGMTETTPGASHRPDLASPGFRSKTVPCQVQGATRTKERLAR